MTLTVTRNWVFHSVDFYYLFIEDVNCFPYFWLTRCVTFQCRGRGSSRGHRVAFYAFTEKDGTMDTETLFLQFSFHTKFSLFVLEMNSCQDCFKLCLTEG